MVSGFLVLTALVVEAFFAAWSSTDGNKRGARQVQMSPEPNLIDNSSLVKIFLCLSISRNAFKRNDVLTHLFLCFVFVCWLNSERYFKTKCSLMLGISNILKLKRLPF